MLNALFAACGLLLGTLLVLGAVGGVVWLCLVIGGAKGLVAAVVIVVLALGS